GHAHERPVDAVRLALPEPSRRLQERQIDGRTALRHGIRASPASTTRLLDILGIEREQVLKRGEPLLTAERLAAAPAVRVLTSPRLEVDAHARKRVAFEQTLADQLLHDVLAEHRARLPGALRAVQSGDLLQAPLQHAETHPRRDAVAL